MGSITPGAAPHCSNVSLTRANAPAVHGVVVSTGKGRGGAGGPHGPGGGGGGASESKAAPSSPNPWGDADESLDAEHRGHVVEDVRVWPTGALPDSEIDSRKPQFGGEHGFEDLKRALYDRGESKSGGTSVTFDIRVQEGQLGYYTSRGGTLHLLKVGRHYKAPGSRDSSYAVVSLDRDEVHLPPAQGEVVPVLHIVRVNPGEIVTATQAGRPCFLEASTDRSGRPTPGWHLIENDRTFAVRERANAMQPVIRAGNSYVINVRPGFFCKAFIGRTPILLAAGQHRINVSGFSLADGESMVSINEPIVKHGQISVIRVAPGLKCRVTLEGRPMLLHARKEPYLFNSPSLMFPPGGAAEAFVSITEKYIAHGTLHEVRLDRGDAALVWLDNRPYVLGSESLLGRDALETYGIDLPPHTEVPRTYRFQSATFRMEMRGGRPAFLNLGEERVVSHGTIKLIRVRQGEVCRVWEGSRPLILSPSDEVYVRNDVSFRLASEAVDGYGAFCRQSDLYITHGIHHMVTVPSGKLCRTWLNGEARILGGGDQLRSSDASIRSLSAVADADAAAAAEGEAPAVASVASGSEVGVDPIKQVDRTFTVESTRFRLADEETDGYSAWVNQSDKVIQHGPIAIVTVEDGEVAVVRNQGRREALKSGRYLLRAPDTVFERHLYVGIRTTAPESISTVDSQRIPLNVAFTVTFEISNPQRAAQYQGEGGLEHFLTQACHSAMRASCNQTHILDMGSSGSHLKHLADGAGAAAVAAASGGDDVGDLGNLFDDSGGGGFAEQAHVAFDHQRRSLEAQLERVGVNLIDLAISDWSISDDAVVRQLEQLAMQNVEAQVSNARFSSQARAAILEAEGKAAAAVAQAKGDAAVRQAQIDAENAAKLSRARSELDAARISADAVKIRAESEAQAVIRKAEAEAAAIREVGSAHAAATRSKLEALAFTPAPEWLRQVQEASCGVLQGANVTVTPEGLASVMGMLNAGSQLFSGMREGASAAMTRSEEMFARKDAPPAPAADAASVTSSAAGGAGAATTTATE